MNFVPMNCAFVTGTGAITLASVVAACRSRTALTNDLQRRERTIRRAMTAAAGMIVAYSLVRDAAVGVLLAREGIDPLVFLFVDLVSIVPYLLGAHQLPGVILRRRPWQLIGWTSCVAFGMVAPGAYLILALQTAGPRALLAVFGYLATIALAVAWGRTRHSPFVARSVAGSGRFLSHRMRQKTT